MQTSAHSSRGRPLQSFFETLSYDVRTLIYQEMLLPPISDECSGFILSCRQAKDETDLFRKEAAERFKGRFEEHFAALTTSRPSIVMSDIMGEHVTVKVRCQPMDDGVNAFMGTVLHGLLPLVQTRFSRATVILNLGPRFHPQTTPNTFHQVTMFLVSSLATSLEKDSTMIHTIGIKHIAFAYECDDNDDADETSSHRHMRGYQYTYNTDIWKSLRAEYPEHSSEISQNTTIPFIYIMSSERQHVGKVGLVIPSGWTNTSIRVLQHMMKGKDFMEKRYCGSDGIGKEIKASGTAVLTRNPLFLWHLSR